MFLVTSFEIKNSENHIKYQEARIDKLSKN